MSSDPMITVVIPVFRQWEALRICLDYLSRQTYQSSAVDIVIVDNEGAGEWTSSVKIPVNARIVTETRPGSYAARNAGIAAARGKLIAFTDADCRPEAGWLKAFAEGARSGATVMAGHVRLVSMGEKLTIAEAYDLAVGFYQGKGDGVTANLAVDRRVLEQVGMFEAEYFSGGDTEFIRRAAAVGYSVEQVPEAIVEHPARRSMSALLRKHRRKMGARYLRWRQKGCLRGLLAIKPPLTTMSRILRGRRLSCGDRFKAFVALCILYSAQVVEVAALFTRLKSPERQ